MGSREARNVLLRPEEREEFLIGVRAERRRDENVHVPVGDLLRGMGGYPDDLVERFQKSGELGHEAEVNVVRDRRSVKIECATTHFDNLFFSVPYIVRGNEV